MNRIAKFALIATCIGLFAGSAGAQGFDSCGCQYVQFLVVQDFFGIGGPDVCDGSPTGVNGDSLPPGWCLSLEGSCGAGFVWVDSGVVPINTLGQYQRRAPGNRIRSAGRITQDDGIIQVCNESDIGDCPRCSDGSSDSAGACPSGPQLACGGRSFCYDYAIDLYCCPEACGAQLRAPGSVNLQEQFHLSASPRSETVAPEGNVAAPQSRVRGK